MVYDRKKNVEFGVPIASVVADVTSLTSPLRNEITAENEQELSSDNQSSEKNQFDKCAISDCSGMTSPTYSIQTNFIESPINSTQHEENAMSPTDLPISPNIYYIQHQEQLSQVTSPSSNLLSPLPIIEPSPIDEHPPVSLLSESPTCDMPVQLEGDLKENLKASFSLKKIISSVRSSMTPLASSFKSIPFLRKPVQHILHNQEEVSNVESENTHNEAEGETGLVASEIEDIRHENENEKLVETKLPIHIRVVQIVTIFLLLACLVVTVNAVICVSLYKSAYSKPPQEIVRNAAIPTGNLYFGDDMNFGIHDVLYVDRPSKLKLALGSFALAPASIITDSGKEFSVGGGNHHDLQQLFEQMSFLPNSELAAFREHEQDESPELGGITMLQATAFKSKSKPASFFPNYTKQHSKSFPQRTSTSTTFNCDKPKAPKIDKIRELSLSLSNVDFTTKSFWFPVVAKVSGSIRLLFSQDLYHTLEYSSPFCITGEVTLSVKTLYLVGRDVKKQFTIFLNDPEVEKIKQKLKFKQKKKKSKKKIITNTEPLFANYKSDLYEMLSNSKIEFDSFQDRMISFAFYPNFPNKSLAKNDFNLTASLPPINLDVVKVDLWNETEPICKLGHLRLESVDVALKMNSKSINLLTPTDNSPAIYFRIILDDFETFFRCYFVELPKGEFAIRYKNAKNSPSILGCLLSFFLNNQMSTVLNKTVFRTFSHSPSLSVQLTPESDGKQAELSVEIRIPRICPIGNPNSIHLNLLPRTKFLLTKQRTRLARLEIELNEFAFSLNDFDPLTFKMDDNSSETIRFSLKLEIFSLFDSWSLMEFVKKMQSSSYLSFKSDAPFLTLRINNKKHRFEAATVNNCIKMLRKDEAMSDYGNYDQKICTEKTLSVAIDLSSADSRNAFFRVPTPFPRIQPNSFDFEKWTNVQDKELTSKIDVLLHADNSTLKAFKSAMIFICKFIYKEDIPSSMLLSLEIPKDKLSTYIEMNGLKIILVNISLEENTFTQKIALTQSSDSGTMQVPIKMVFSGTAETKPFFNSFSWLRIDSKLGFSVESVGEVLETKDVLGKTMHESKTWNQLAYIGNMVMMFNTHSIPNPSLLGTLIAACIGPIEMPSIDFLVGNEGSKTIAKDHYDVSNSILIPKFTGELLDITARISLGYKCDWIKISFGKGLYFAVNQNDTLTMVPERESPDVVAYVEDGKFLYQRQDSLESISSGRRSGQLWKTVHLLLNGDRQFSSCQSFMKNGPELISIPENTEIHVIPYKCWSEYSPKVRTVSKLLGSLLLNQHFNGFISMGICKENPSKQAICYKTRFKDWSQLQITFPVSLHPSTPKEPSYSGVTKAPEKEISFMGPFIRLKMKAIKPIGMRMIDLKIENIRIVVNIALAAGKDSMMEFFDFNMQQSNSINDWLSPYRDIDLMLHDMKDILTYKDAREINGQPTMLSWTKDSMNFITVKLPYQHRQITLPLSIENYPPEYSNVDSYCTLPDSMPGDGGIAFFTAGKEVVPQIFRSKIPRGHRITANHSLLIKFEFDLQDLENICEEDITVYTTDDEAFCTIQLFAESAKLKIRTLGEVLTVQNIPQLLPLDAKITIGLYFSPLTSILEVIFHSSSQPDDYFVTKYKASHYYQKIKDRNIVIDNLLAPEITEDDDEDDSSLQEMDCDSQPESNRESCSQLLFGKGDNLSTAESKSKVELSANIYQLSIKSNSPSCSNNSTVNVESENSDELTAESQNSISSSRNSLQTSDASAIESECLNTISSNYAASLTESFQTTSDFVSSEIYSYDSEDQEASDETIFAPTTLVISMHFIYPDFTKTRLLWDRSDSSKFIPGLSKLLKFIHYDAGGVMVHLPTEIYCEQTRKMQSLFSVRILHKRLARHNVPNTSITLHSNRSAYQCGSGSFSVYCMESQFVYAGPYEVQLFEGTEKVYRKSFHIYLVSVS